MRVCIFFIPWYRLTPALWSSTNHIMGVKNERALSLYGHDTGGISASHRIQNTPYREW